MKKLIFAINSLRKLIFVYCRFSCKKGIAPEYSSRNLGIFFTTVSPMLGYAPDGEDIS